MLVARLINGILQTGWLTLIDATGKRHEFKVSDWPHVTIRLHDRRLHTSLFVNPGLRVGEAYMDGTLTIEDGDIYDFLDLMFRSLRWRHPTELGLLSRFATRFVRLHQQYNPISRARQNVAHHYDLSDTLYDLFLDDDRQYSCGYFHGEDESIEKAQQNKKAHVAAKLLLKPEHRVLDIGCGWGGLAMFLNEISGADVTGITLSREQATYAQNRARETGKDGSVDFHLKDYREVDEKFDRIVSVGMFEHVGLPQYSTFFEKSRELLSDDGVMLLHTIGRADGPGITNSWIRKYIFPGGYSPALSEILPRIERAGLVVTDIEVLRLHYAETLRRWRQRFFANIDQVRELYDDRFCRMWEFYLAASEVTFRYAGHVVFQIQMSKDQAAVPLTRDYISEWEADWSKRKADSAAA